MGNSNEFIQIDDLIQRSNHTLQTRSDKVPPKNSIVRIRSKVFQKISFYFIVAQWKKSFYKFK